MKRIAMGIVLAFALLLGGALLGNVTSGTAHAATTKTTTTAMSLAGKVECRNAADLVQVYVGGALAACYSGAGYTSAGLPISGVNLVCAGNYDATFWLYTPGSGTYTFALSKGKCSNTNGNDTLTDLVLAG
jgi:hypothetical protein